MTKKKVSKRPAKVSAKKSIKKKKVVDSKNVTKKKVSAKVLGKKRGRKPGRKPKELKSNIKDTGVKFSKVSGKKVDETISLNLRTGKFLGYCYFCDNAVADFDIISGTKYSCIGCGKSGLLNKLKKEILLEPKWNSKKEYLNSTVFDSSSSYATFVPEPVSDKDEKDEEESVED